MARTRQKALSHGRPRITKPKEYMSSQQSRTIIRTHHRLHKEHAAAIRKGDSKLAESITRAIENNGGIEVYQAASKQGQSKDRGGDSSKVLIDWLRNSRVFQSDGVHKDDGERREVTTIRCLEVGALSIQNEISKYPNRIAMTRIDLNSQGPGIEKQDFMQRPLPSTRTECFDLISLSLVLNYVPEAPQRGEMLKRITKFLRRQDALKNTDTAVFPALFLVLPLPCVENSRYLDDALLQNIMMNLGFTLTQQKKTPKLCYYLFHFNGNATKTKTGKRKVRDGPAMNNFCIVVD